MVVVAVLFDFGGRWEDFWSLVDVCLLGAELGAEMDVVNVTRLVDEREEALASHGVVFVAYACCDDRSQRWTALVAMSLSGPAVLHLFDSFDRAWGQSVVRRKAYAVVSHWFVSSTFPQ